MAAYISLNPSSDGILAQHLRPDTAAATGITVVQLAPAIVRATAGLSDLDHFYNLMFGVMALMGHAVYM